jgi:hypothetical protein
MRNETLRIQRLRGGTLFKIIFIGNSLFFIPFSVLMGILSFFGAATIRWNEQPLTGFAGFVASPYIGVFITLLFSAFLWVSTFIGLWLYSKFRPIELEYIAVSDEETAKIL